MNSDSLETYRPLPNSVTVCKSNIDGLGLFATEDIIKGDLIGITVGRSTGNDPGRLNLSVKFQYDYDW